MARRHRASAKILPEERRNLLTHCGYLMFLRPEDRFLVKAAMIESMPLTEEKDVLNERVGNVEVAGYDRITIQVVEGHESALEDWAEVFSR